MSRGTLVSARSFPSFAYGAFTLSGRSSQDRSAGLLLAYCGPEPRYARISVWAPPGSLAATSGITFVFSSSGYLDVSVHRVPSIWLCIHHTVTGVPPAGFPHSEIDGSMDICSSPSLIAAYHVFLRLLVPRHPPCALSSLTSLAQCIALHRLVVFFVLFSDVLTRSFDLISDRFNMRFSRYVLVLSCFHQCKHSGDKGIRTPDPLLARQVLSQLSYTPKGIPAATCSSMPSPA